MFLRVARAAARAPIEAVPLSGGPALTGGDQFAGNLLYSGANWSSLLRDIAAEVAARVRMTTRLAGEH